MNAAAQLASDDPSTLNDLGAIYYTRAAVTGDPRDLEEGLRLVESALRIDSGRVEALFNRALLIEALALPAAARDAWREYLSHEVSASPWRRDALAHVSRLTEPSSEALWRRALARSGAATAPLNISHLYRLAQAFPEQTHEWIESELLPGWAEAWRKGLGPEAMSRLWAAELTSKALAAGSKDPFLADPVGEVVYGASGNDPEHVRQLATSLLDSRDGRAALLGGRPTEAAEHFERAEAELSAAEPALRDLARYYRAVCVFGQGRYAEAARKFHSLASTLSPRRHALLGQIETYLGLIQNLEGAPERGRDELIRALTHLTDPASLSEAAFAHVELGESYDMLGDREQAWRHFYAALHSNRERRSTYRTVQIYNSLADFTLRLGDLGLSYCYQDAAVEASRDLDNPGFAADVLLWRALLQVRLGRSAAAKRDLALATAEAGRIVDSPPRSRFQADLALVTGTMALKANPNTAALQLSNAVLTYRALGHWPSLLLAYEALAQAHRALGDPVAEKADLVESLKLYERAGRQLQDDSMRIALAGVIENVFDHMAEFLVTREKNPERAVHYLERAKILNWPIPQTQPRTGTSSAELVAVRRLLPSHTALVEYAVLPDRLFIWVQTATSQDFYERPVSREEVDRMVGKFLDSDWDSVQWRSASDELFRLLTEPWLAPGRFTNLVLVPDKSLFRLSFAALWDSRRERFLVEDAAILVSPSAALFTLASQRDRALLIHGSNGKILVLAASLPGAEGNLLLPRLERARVEGARIRALFPRSTVLLSGSDAVPSAFFQYARQARWIHFAGHSLASPDRPLDSELVFASPGRGRRSTVTGTEIQSLAFPLTQLVTLSACSTAVAPRAAWPGALSLARPFLTAGVPTVLGSLWDVDDAEAEALFGGFYEALKGGANPAEALRRSQLRLLTREGRDHLRKSGWPAFEIFGGLALD